MSHRNARTTFQGRLLIVRRYQQGWKQAHIAAAMGISRKCIRGSAVMARKETLDCGIGLRVRIVRRVARPRC